MNATAEKKGVQVSAQDRATMRRMGAIGGRASGPRKARDPEKMRAAARRRWDLYRARVAAGLVLPKS